MLTRNNITQSTGSDFWSIDFAQKTGYDRRIIGINPSKNDIIFVRAEFTTTQVQIYLKNIGSSSITFNLEVYALYTPVSS